MSEHEQDIPEEIRLGLAIQDFLDGRGWESEHVTTQQLEALFELVDSLPELALISAVVDAAGVETGRLELVMFLKREAVKRRHGLEDEIEDWVQAFVTKWES